MKKNLLNMSLICLIPVCAAISGCGGNSASPPAQATKVSGVAAAGAPIRGIVYLKDSSAPARIRATATSSKGAFSLDTTGLTPPFILKIDPVTSATTSQMYSLAAREGRTNINPLSDAAVAAAGDDDSERLYDHSDPHKLRTTADNLEGVMRKLRDVLAPLFKLYSTSQDPINGEFEADHTGLDALFDDVRISVSAGIVYVTNKRTGGVIYSAPVNDIGSGTFNPANMPGTPGQIDGAALYDNNCSGCHGSLSTSSKLGATAEMIQDAIQNDTGGMGSLSKLTALDIQAIAQALATGTTTTPPPPPPTTDGASLYATYCASCHGSLSTSSKQDKTAAQITSAISSVSSMRSLSNLTADQIAAIAAALATTSTPPAVCTYTYNPWGDCQQDDTQTRTVATATPAGCTGTPLLTQSCVYVPPQPTVTLAQVTASCTGCHGLTSNTTVLRSGGYTVTGRTAADWLTTVNSMVRLGASLASGTTAQDYADFLAGLP
jgi:mono/diheme cytochrome c family protein